MDSPESRERKLIGEVTHYFGKIGVAVVNVKSPLHQGDQILIEGSTTSIRQKAQSLQYNRKSIQEARPGLSIGLKVSDRVRERDKVFVLRPGLKIDARAAKPTVRKAAKALRRSRPVRSRPKLRSLRPKARPKLKSRSARLKLKARPKAVRSAHTSSRSRPTIRSVRRSSRPKVQTRKTRRRR